MSALCSPAPHMTTVPRLPLPPATPTSRASPSASTTGTGRLSTRLIDEVLDSERWSEAPMAGRFEQAWAA